MSVYTAVIIDDNQWDAKDLELTLVDVGVFEEIKVFSNVKEAKKWLQGKNLPVDFIFCDIEMEGISGIEARQSLKSYTLFFVFFTGHEKYSLQAHRIHADGYLMKPAEEEEILSLVDKFRERQKKTVVNEIDYFMLDSLQKNGEVAGRELHKVKIADISHFKKDGNYVYAYGDVRDVEKRDFQKLGVFDGDIKSFMKKYWCVNNLLQINGGEVLNMDWVDFSHRAVFKIKNVEFRVTDTFAENVLRFTNRYTPNPKK